ncbi:strigolactone esterase D14-like [Quercus suber]|uniref:strigolactone esterase D14-like n=1 Tax=Quercus suber TaxID=58331 RepID=UPI0032DE6798
MDTLCDYGGHIVEALNVNVYGNGTQALVLAHGFGADQTLWHYLIPYLACYFKVVVFDLVFSPNVNPDLYNPKKYSNFNGYVQDLLCLLDQLNVNKTIYLGHSMSAMIGCIAATKRPDLFEHLILLSGSPSLMVLLDFDFYVYESDAWKLTLNGSIKTWTTKDVMGSVLWTETEATIIIIVSGSLL